MKSEREVNKMKNAIKNQRIAVILLIVVAISILAGCSSENQPSDSNDSYTKITAEEAKIMIDQENDLIILDVRTPEEFDAGHIPGAVNISSTEITATVEGVITDKSDTILVYCRSGSRSAGASQELSNLGYTNVYDFGGIINWNYEVVTD